ncbi:EAL domain-containing protein [Aliikangiella sp. G2MR2-5]|uniref:EAL domain-containing protein n=1 Tax=Aliikangiella sp. G2MR2-5 TaxID=2788943 RepID=UPI0018A90470|nr:EAL domain-containing protein [Aliikangiella sp. G2MR2-5]
MGLTSTEHQYFKHNLIGLMLIVLAVLSSPVYLRAESLYQFHSLTKKDGLASSVVFDTVQDSYGFIWLATEDGLQRYDGAELITYRHNKEKPNSLSSNLVRSLYIDKTGTLWVGTESGVNIYQRESDDFRRVGTGKAPGTRFDSDVIRTIYQTSDGIIWVGTAAGLNALDLSTNKIFSYSGFDHKVRALLEDEQKQLWVGTLGGGVFLLDRSRESFLPVSLLPDEASISEGANYVVDLYQDSFGRILVATWGEGVFLLKRDERKLSRYQINLPSQYVSTIFQDADSLLWFGTSMGILVVDQASEVERTIIADNRYQWSLLNNAIQQIFQSRDQTIWIGTYGGGISRYYPSSHQFESFGIHRDSQQGLIDPVTYALSENSNGKIWVGSESGQLALFDPSSKRFKHFPLTLEGRDYHSAIRHLLQISEETLLVGTEDGLYRYGLTDGQFSRVTDDADPLLMAEQDIMFLLLDGEQRVWVGVDEKGVQAYRLMQGGTLKAIKGLFISSPSPKALLISNNNLLIFAGHQEPIQYLQLNDQPQTNGASLQKLKSVVGSEDIQVTNMAMDWQGRLWVATQSSGIKIYQNDTKPISLGESEGLPNNSVYVLLADRNTKKIWASTNQGVTAINAENLELESFTVLDGLQGDEFNLPGIKSSNGYLYFGGVSGFNRFFPTVKKEPVVMLAPLLTEFSVANQKIAIGPNSLLSQSLMLTKKVTLEHWQLPFSIGYTSPQFFDARQLQFRYRLVGLSDKWVLAQSNERKAIYTNVPAGDYQFQLQVGTQSGSWSADIKELQIRVNPPWWFTTKAKVSYVITALVILMFIVGMIYRRRYQEKLSRQKLQESEERLKLSLWGSGYEFWDWDLNTGKVSRSNEYKRVHIDCHRLSRNLLELASYIHPSDLDMVREKLTNHIAGNTKFFDICYRVVDAFRGWRWIEDRGKVVSFNPDGSAMRMAGTQRDITDLRQRDAQFEMFGKAFNSTSDGVWIRDSEWRLIQCNPAFERISGFSLSEKYGEVLWFPDYQEQPENLLQRIRMSIDDKGSWQGEVWAERKNSEPFPQKLSIDTLKDVNQDIQYYVGVFSDITFHKRTEEEFRRLANYDSLTGLPNRSCLYDRLNQTIEKTRRDKSRFALFMIDVDNFKRINDSLGHSVGDILIRQVASRLVNCNKEGDTVARIGGDEFVIVMENIRSSSAVAAFSELLLKELNQPIFIKGQQLKLNFSIGVTLGPDDAIVAERLMRNADTAMYEAKKSIENSYRFFSVEFNERARKRLELENALRKAIEEQTIEVHYQPKIDLSTGKVCGLEALARWTDKNLGFISPAEFIPLAEETGLILPLGNLILTKAIKDTKKWVDNDELQGRTSVNLSAVQFWNKNLVDSIGALLVNESLSSEFIELEITESACMQDIEETREQMDALKSLGLSLALDDFGTGYSSLAQLKKLPFDTLKVDKSFIDNIDTNQQDAKVVKAIIDIAKTMEMQVVIEGVESKQQCQHLWLNRAYIVQGFYFSRPVPKQQVSELLKKQWQKKEYLSKLSSNVTILG